MASSQRYRAASRVTYAWALIALFEYAREHSDPDFSFGPLDLPAMENHGLVVSGEDLSGVSRVLALVPGLTEVDA